jgi:hypothetical protein
MIVLRAAQIGGRFFFAVMRDEAPKDGAMAGILFYENPAGRKAASSRCPAAT